MCASRTSPGIFCTCSFFREQQTKQRDPSEIFGGKPSKGGLDLKGKSNLPRSPRCHALSCSSSWACSAERSYNEGVVVRTANGTANPVAPWSPAASMGGWVRVAASRTAPTRWLSVLWWCRHSCRHDALNDPFANRGARPENGNYSITKNPPLQYNPTLPLLQTNTLPLNQSLNHALPRK